VTLTVTFPFDLHLPTRLLSATEIFSDPCFISTTLFAQALNKMMSNKRLDERETNFMNILLNVTYVEKTVT
jgi:hypothetical protein